MPFPDDLDELMSRASLDGDQAAFSQVVEQTHHLIRASILRLVGHVELADELAQDVMVRAWERRSQYRAGTSPRAWLLAIARSQVMNVHRRAERDRRHVDELIRQELLRHKDQSDSDDLTAARLAALRVCLESVGGNQRELLDLIHGQGLSSDDASEVLGINSAACRQRLSRLQRELRICCEERMKGGA